MLKDTMQIKIFCAKMWVTCVPFSYCLLYHRSEILFRFFYFNSVLFSTSFIVCNVDSREIFTMLVKSTNREESRLVLLNKRLARFALLSGHVLSKPHPSPFFPTPFLPHSNFLVLSLQFTPLLFPEDVRNCTGKKMVFGPHSFWQNWDDFRMPQNFWVFCL